MKNDLGKEKWGEDRKESSPQIFSHFDTVSISYTILSLIGGYVYVYEKSLS